MSNWFIIHFQPLERYPPAVNFIRFVASQPDYYKDLNVVTVHPGKGKKTYEFSDVITHRLGTIKKRGKIQRILFYLLFNIKTLLLLLKYRPAVILYYESLSGFAPLWYKKWINKKARIFIHYHEYTSPEEYASGMLLSRLIHKGERAMYNKATWVSHTNSKRMELFLHDIGKDQPQATFILPNYPPLHWINSASVVKRAADKRIGFVQVGALSLNSMFTKEMAEFVAGHPEECYWHIYSDNHDKDAKEFLANFKVPNIEFKGGVPYDELPAVLAKYDIGVILYKGVIDNHVYSEPNKFFEYLICGLNVWYPKEIKGMYRFEQPDNKPWVRRVDFAHLQLPSLLDGYRKEKLLTQEYTAESVYISLWRKLKNIQN